MPRQLNNNGEKKKPCILPMQTDVNHEIQGQARGQPRRVGTNNPLEKQRRSGNGQTVKKGIANLIST